jgi:hypothetical protein
MHQTNLLVLLDAYKNCQVSVLTICASSESA